MNNFFQILLCICIVALIHSVAKCWIARDCNKKLKNIQLEKIAQLYRFAEFGKLSSGLFHDLINPLTALSLQLHDIDTSHQSITSHTLRNKLNAAIAMSKKMECFMCAIRKQLSQESNICSFVVKDEIDQAVELLTHKAEKEHVTIKYTGIAHVILKGNPLKFQQIVLNLLSNAIDAYKNVQKVSKKCVHILLKKHAVGTHQNNLVISIQDFGSGIDPVILPHIFEPFFSTKTPFDGNGLGLSTTQSIIEHDFKGKLAVTSEFGTMTTFTLTIPL